MSRGRSLMRMSIRWKLILAIGVPLLLVYAVMLAIVIDQIGARAWRQMEHRVIDLAGHHAARADARFREVARTADVTAGLLPAVDPAAMTAAMERAVAIDPLVASVRLALSDGPAAGAFLLVARGDDGEVVRRDLAAEGRKPPSSIARGRGGWTEPHLDDLTGDPACGYVVPLAGAGGEIGRLTLTVALASIRDELNWVDREGVVFGIVSREGRGVHDPLREFDEDQNLFAIASGSSDAGFGDLAERIAGGETGVVQAEGLLLPGRRWIVFAPMASTGWSFVATVPESEVLAFSRSQLQLGLVILLGGLAVILALLWLMATRITRPLARLASGVEHLGTGDLATRVEGITTRDEIGDLAETFNRMVGDLKTHVDALTRETAAREAVESELRVGRRIQASLLPTEFPRRDDFELYAVNHPAKHVAGDFFDWFWLDEDRLAFLIADVSGKGVPAALFMAVSRTVLRQVCDGKTPLADAVRRANEILEGTGVGSMYTTLFIAWYEPAGGALRYVNGGHPPGYRVTLAGKVEPFGSVTGSPVGLLPGRTFAEKTERLEPGDRLVLFTDGIPEAEAPDGEFFGDERLQALLRELATDSAEGLCQGIARHVDRYEEGDPHDDVTVMVLARKAHQA